MRMKGFVFLVVNLAVSTASAIRRQEPGLVEIGDDKDITEINKDLLDDIMEPQDIQRSAITYKEMLWTSPVAYVLGEDLEMNAKGVILRAFDQFRLKTCIDFKPRDSEKYYISARKMSGCFSYIGRVISNGQILSIGKYCDEISTVEHEFLHALGFHHEQSRSDRDDHVTIVYENIIEGRENNFKKAKDNTQGLAYDYSSVMHYGKDAFSNGNGSTIITKDPKFQDVIGQRLEMSPDDALGLNLLYECKSTIAFQMYCGFSNGDMCQMTRCSQSDNGWEMVTKAPGGPSSDHTSLPSGSPDDRRAAGYFMHASTASGKEGDSAWLETHRMSPKRDCHIQCLQFYYYHTGSSSDQLNIWIRAFEDEGDVKGTLSLVGQITGPPTSHWQLQHVSLKATKHFQVVFEVRKGAGASKGGFSIDDINLSETECPHVTLQIDDFEEVLSTSEYGERIYSPRHYSSGGYAYRVGVLLYQSVSGVFVQMLSGKYDDKLKWPCPQRQVTFQLLDQNPLIQLQMSKQRSITSNPHLSSNGRLVWGDPRENGAPFVDENNQTGFAGPMAGMSYFMSLEQMKSKDFLKGGSAIFIFSFQDITPLLHGSALPCPEVVPKRTASPLNGPDDSPCSSRIVTTTPPPPATTDNSIFGFSPRLTTSMVLLLLPALIHLVH